MNTCTIFQTDEEDIALPMMTETDLTAAIAAGKVGAITLDTSIFDKFGCNLMFKTLRSLNQFRGTEIAVVFSEVVAGEVQRHIARDAAAAAAKLRAALNQHRKFWRQSRTIENLCAAVDLGGDAVAHGRATWENFVAEVNGEVIPAEGYALIGDVIGRYFENRAPFSGEGAKKDEFPDAIALLSLEGWAAAQGTVVLVVSGDGDWKSYAASSSRLVCFDDVTSALNLFNGEARFVATRIASMLVESRAPELKDEIESAIEYFLDDSSVEVEARADFEFEAELTGASLQYWKLVDEVRVVTADADQVTFAITLDCKVSFEAAISWFAYDSVDKDWNRIHTSTALKENDLPIELTVTCRRDIRDQPEVVEVEVNKRSVRPDLGYIDPQWDYEE